VNLRFARGQAVADLAVVPVDTAGEITLYNPSTGAVQLLGDIAGYYLAGTPSAAGGRAALFLEPRRHASAATWRTVTVRAPQVPEEDRGQFRPLGRVDGQPPAVLMAPQWIA